MEDIYFEKQTENNTCFIHAINNYFQREYINETFFKKLKDFSIQNIEYSFFGNKEPFKNEKNDNFDYYELYKIQDFKIDIENNQCKELSPLEGLFILQNEIINEKIEYNPLRFYHRFANGIDKEETLLEFIEIIEKNSKIEKIFFCNLVNKPHAFCVIKKNEKWYILDSLKEIKIIDTIFDLFLNISNISIMIFQNKEE